MSNTFYSADQRIVTQEVFSNCTKLVVYDLETTGLKSAEDRIIEFSAVKYLIAENSLHEMSRVTVYIKPDFPLPKEIVDITGYTDEFLADKAGEDAGYTEIKRFLHKVDAVCGYNNNSFDDNFLKELYLRHNDVFVPSYSIDVMKAARQFIKKDEVENFKLVTISTYLGVAGGIEFHKAFDDVTATARVFNALLPELLKATSGDYPNEIPTIQSVAFWEGFKGWSRIYVTTNKGSVYFDIRRKAWEGKDVDVRDINMPYIVNESYRMVGANDETEFARFKGSIKGCV